MTLLALALLLCALCGPTSCHGDSTTAQDFDPEWNFKNKKDLHAEIPDGLVIEGIDDYDSSGMTPLLNAVAAYHTEAVKQLLKGGADANKPDGDGHSPLLAASERGAYDIVSLLLDRKADVAACDRAGRSALYVASQGGHADVARLLLRHGASPDAQGRAGMAALMVAALKGYSTAVKALLESGADPNLANDSGETALVLVAISPAISVAIEPAEGQGSGEPDCLQLLIDARADVDATDVDRRTALMKAAERGRTLVVERLLAAGAVVDLKDKLGKTALVYAMVCDNL